MSLSTIEIGSPIRDIALSPDGATAYVGSCGPDFGTVLDVIDVRDVRASAITNTYKIGDAAGVLAQLAMSRNGQRAYLVGDQSVTVLSTSTQDIIGSIEIGGQPSCAIESPDGKRLYIADYAGMVTVLGIAAPTAPADAPTSDDEPTAAHPWAFPDLLGTRADADLARVRRHIAGQGWLTERGMIATRAGVWRAGPR